MKEWWFEHSKTEQRALVITAVSLVSVVTKEVLVLLDNQASMQRTFRGSFAVGLMSSNSLFPRDDPPLHSDPLAEL